MTIIQNSRLENISTFNYDICIIGSGMCGQIVSSEIKNKKILIVESGSLNYDNEVQKLNNFSTTGLNFRKNYQNRVRQLGGSANLWANQLMFVSQKDYENKKWIDENQHVFLEFNDLEKYYDKAIKKIYKKDFINFYNVKNLAKFSKNSRFIEKELINDTEFNVTNHFWPSNVEKFNFQSNFTKKIINSKNIDLVCNYTATEFKIDEDKERVELVKISSNKKNILVKANVFVLACGAIENARILLNNQSKSKIFQNKNIGKYFMEHPRLNLGLITSKKKLSLNTFFGIKFNNYSIKQSLSFNINYLIKNKLLNSYAFIDPKFNKIDEILFNEFLKSIKILFKKKKISSLNFKNIKFKNFAEQIYFNLPPQVSKSYLNNILRIIFQRRDYTFSFNKMDINYQGEQFPNYNSSVFLSDKNDIFNQKKIVLNWQLNDIDYKTIDHVIKILHN